MRALRQGTLTRYLRSERNPYKMEIGDRLRTFDEAKRKIEDSVARWKKYGGSGNLFLADFGLLENKETSRGKKI